MKYIEITFYHKEEVSSASKLLQRFKLLSDNIGIFRGGNVDWFLPAETENEALNKRVFNKEGVVQETLSILEASMKGSPLVVEKIWSREGDKIIVFNYICSKYNLFRYNLSIEPNDKMNIPISVINCVKAIIRDISPHIILVETNFYSRDNHQVFPDRLPVGWMMYIDKSYDKDELGLGEQMLPMHRSGTPMGTLFITKPGLFDGANKDDIQLANDLEIALVAHNILPTFSTIFEEK